MFERRRPLVIGIASGGAFGLARCLFRCLREGEVRRNSPNEQPNRNGCGETDMTSNRHSTLQARRLHERPATSTPINLTELQLILKAARHGEPALDKW